jgi:hypothetical protein
MNRRLSSSLQSILAGVVSGANAARALALGAVVVAPACSSIQSEDIDTDAITAEITVHPRRDGSACDVSATLQAGTLTFVDLTGGDVLVARSGDNEVRLDRNAVLGAVAYEGTLQGVGAAGDEVTVALQRTAFPSAPSSTVTLPAQVSITQPEAATSFSRAESDIVVTLAEDGSTDPVKLSWSGDCVQGGNIDIAGGQTSVTIPRGTLQKAEPSPSDADAEPVADSCTLRLTVVRSVQGILDEAFEDGRISAFTDDSLELTTTP